MKKITIVLALFLLIGIASAFAQDSFTYDLSKFPATRNSEPFTKIYDDFFILLPEVDVDLTRYRNVIVRAAAFDENGEEIGRGHNKSMVTIYVAPVTPENVDAYRRDGNPTHVVKAFNVSTRERMGGADAISQNTGDRAIFRAGSGNPVLLHFQTSNADVKWIEVREVTFRNPRR